MLKNCTYCIPYHYVLSAMPNGSAHILLGPIFKYYSLQLCKCSVIRRNGFIALLSQLNIFKHCLALTLECTALCILRSFGPKSNVFLARSFFHRKYQHLQTKCLVFVPRIGFGGGYLPHLTFEIPFMLSPPAIEDKLLAPP